MQGHLMGIDYLIDELSIEYVNGNEQLPDESEVLGIQIPFALIDGVYEEAGAEEDLASVKLSRIPRGARFSDGALREILNAVVSYMNSRDFYGVYVVTGQDQIDPRTGRDRREPGDATLTLNIYVGEIQEIQSVGKGERIGEDRPVNHEHHSLILKNSPLKPLGERESPDLFRREHLDNYLRRLNRHPGRRVDATIASSGDPGKIDLHYLVTESRPWYAYGMVSNTGTRSVGKWQTRAGVGHRQLTGRDDILTLDYEASDFEDSFSVLAGYQLPVIYPDYVMLSLSGSYSQFQGEEFGVGTILNFAGESQTYSVELQINPWTILDFAHTYYLGVKRQSVEVTQEIFLGQDPEASVAATFGEDDLSYLYGGVEFMRRGRFMDTFVTTTFEGTLNEVSEEALDNLGRLDADRGWVLMQWNIQHAFFLEPLIFPQRFRDVESWKTSTMGHEISLAVRGQQVLSDDRIIPQKQFVVGGMRSIRGYPESVAAADSGWFIQSEYRVHIPRLLKPYSEFSGEEEKPRQFRDKWNLRPPRPLINPDWDFIIRAFMDYGRTENIRVESFETDQNLWSGGVGLEFQVGQYFTLQTDAGMVLNSLDEFDSGSGGRTPIDNAQSHDVRIHLQGTFVW